MRAKIIKAILVLSLMLGIAIPALPVSAAGAEIYLSANHSTIGSGATVIVAVYMNGGGSPINAVEADLNYPAAKLQYVGISYSGSAFSIDTPTNGGGSGAVSIQNGSVTPVSGSGLVATVTFKALVGSGSAAIGVSGSSSLINANDNSAVAYSPGGVSINFGAVAVVSSSSVTTKTTAAPAAPAAAPAPPKDVTPPVITAIKLKDVTPYTATVTWTTNEPADSTVEYGVDTTYGLTASSATLTTAHAVALSSSFLSPETLLHYAIKTADASGNVQTSPDQELNLPGVPVTIIVRGASGKPQSGATVTLDNKTATTNNQGSVTLASALGNEKVITTYNGSTVEKPITVTKSSKPLVAYQLDLSRQPINHWMITSISLVVVVLILLGFDAVMFGSQIFSRLMGLNLKPKTVTVKSESAPHIESVPPPVVSETPRVAVTPPISAPARETVDLLTPVADPFVRQAPSHFMLRPNLPEAPGGAAPVSPATPIQITEMLPPSAPVVPTTAPLVTRVPIQEATEPIQIAQPPLVLKAVKKKSTVHRKTRKIKPTIQT